MENSALRQLGHFPFKAEFGICYMGRILPVWVYDKVPDGMRRISSISELRYGKPFLYSSQLFPGEYHTEYMRREVIESVKWYLESGFPIYVKK